MVDVNAAWRTQLTADEQIRMAALRALTRTMPDCTPAEAARLLPAFEHYIRTGEVKDHE